MIGQRLYTGRVAVAQAHTHTHTHTPRSPPPPPLAHGRDASSLAHDRDASSLAHDRDASSSRRPILTRRRAALSISRPLQAALSYRRELFRVTKEYADAKPIPDVSRSGAEPMLSGIPQLRALFAEVYTCAGVSGSAGGGRPSVGRARTGACGPRRDDRAPLSETDLRLSGRLARTSHASASAPRKQATPPRNSFTRPLRVRKPHLGVSKPHLPSSLNPARRHIKRSCGRACRAALSVFASPRPTRPLRGLTSSSRAARADSPTCCATARRPTPRSPTRSRPPR